MVYQNEEKKYALKNRVQPYELVRKTIVSHGMFVCDGWRDWLPHVRLICFPFSLKTSRAIHHKVTNVVIVHVTFWYVIIFQFLDFFR